MADGNEGNRRFLAPIPAVLGLMAVAFATGDFIGQWRIRNTIEGRFAQVAERLARIEERSYAHQGLAGHSKVIERLTALERDMDHLKHPWKSRQQKENPYDPLQ